MTIAPLVSLAVAAGGTIAAVATDALDSLTSFVDVLNQPAGEDQSQPVDLAAAPSAEEDAETAAREALAKFRELLYPRLDELGIDLSQPVSLASDGLGNIRETSGHPQGPQIEQLLATDDNLERQFRQAASQFELMRESREQAQFAELYGKNPELAMTQYARLLDDRQETPKFSLRLSGTTAEPGFE